MMNKPKFVIRPKQEEAYAGNKLTFSAHSREEARKRLDEAEKEASVRVVTDEKLKVIPYRQRTEKRENRIITSEGTERVSRKERERFSPAKDRTTGAASLTEDGKLANGTESPLQRGKRDDVYPAAGKPPLQHKEQREAPERAEGGRGQAKEQREAPERAEVPPIRIGIDPAPVTDKENLDELIREVLQNERMKQQADSKRRAVDLKERAVDLKERAVDLRGESADSKERVADLKGEVAGSKGESPDPKGKSAAPSDLGSKKEDAFPYFPGLYPVDDREETRRQEDWWMDRKRFGESREKHVPVQEDKGEQGAPWGGLKDEGTWKEGSFFERRIAEKKEEERDAGKREERWRKEGPLPDKKEGLGKETEPLFEQQKGEGARIRKRKEKEERFSDRVKLREGEGRNSGSLLGKREEKEERFSDRVERWEEEGRNSDPLLGKRKEREERFLDGVERWEEEGRKGGSLLGKSEEKEERFADRVERWEEEERRSGAWREAPFRPEKKEGESHSGVTPSKEPNPSRNEVILSNVGKIYDEPENGESPPQSPPRKRRNLGWLKLFSSIIGAILLGFLFGYLLLMLLISGDWFKESSPPPASPSSGAAENGGEGGTKVIPSSQVNLDPSQAGKAAAGVLQLGDRTFYAIQGGVFTDRKTGDAQAEATRKKGLPALLFDDASLRLFLGVSYRKEDAVNLAGYFQNKGVEIYLKEYTVPGGKMNFPNAKEEEMKKLNLFLTHGTYLLEKTAAWSGQGVIGKANITDEEWKKFKDTHRLFLLESKQVEPILSEEQKAILSKMTTEMNTAITGMVEYVKNPDVQYLMQSQQGLLSYFEQYRKLLASAGVNVTYKG